MLCAGIVTGHNVLDELPPVTPIHPGGKNHFTHYPDMVTEKPRELDRQCHKGTGSVTSEQASSLPQFTLQEGIPFT